MADISQEISAFQNAVYGEEVRGSMISLAEKLNDVTEDCESTVGTMEARYDAAMAAASSATAAASDAASSATGAASSATSAAASANSAASNATSKANAAQALSDGITAAETARASAETARRSAETSRANAEAARVTAETARAGSESNRQSAELTRQEAETARNSAELSRVTAEANRSASETQRQSNESTRQSAESNRSTVFAQMQSAFDDMTQQVLPPATTSTIGGVIVGEGLSVAADGTLSFEAGDFITEDEAAATYATITSVQGKADAVHYHAASDVTSGTLAVARGGTGVSTAAAERERLGLGSTTDALPVANGGTGATTASGALSAILGGDPLSVANGGTGSDSLTANAVLAGNGTGAVDELATASGALYATTSGGAASFGTLPVAQGGTGATTLTANGILQGDDTSAISAISTASGALYATAADGAASFGTLPVAQGGTGSTTAAGACTALGALPLTGGTINGGDLSNVDNSFVYKSSTLQRGVSPGSSSLFIYPLKVQDKNGVPIAYFDAAVRPSGGGTVRMLAWGGTNIYNGISAHVDTDGTKSYSITDPAAFRNAIGASSGIWPVSVGGTGTAHYGKDGPADVNGSSVNVASGTDTTIATMTFSNAGTYLIIAGFNLGANTSGRRVVGLSFDNTTGVGARVVTTSAQPVNGYGTFLNIITVRTMSANDKARANVSQTSGSTISCSCYMTAFRLK